VVLSAVSLGTFISTLNASIVNSSLPTLADNFNVSIPDIEWVVVAFLLATGVLLLTFGRLGDIVGYKRVYVGGFVIFALAGAVCGLSQSVAQLIGLRVLQGVGAGMIQAIGPAIVTATFSSQERGKALGLNGMSVAVGLALGPTLGGILTDWLSWRWIFFVNLPVGVFGVLWALRVLSDRDRDESQQQRFDPLGAGLASGALLALLLALSEGSSWGWGSFETIGLLAAFGLLGAAFIVTELRVSQPMLDLKLFAIRSFSAGNTSLLIAFAALFAANFLLPFFLERGQGLSALESGLLLTPLPLGILVVAPLSGALSDRIGSQVPSTAGLTVLTVGLLSLTGVGAETGHWGLIWRFAMVGTGIGLFNSPNQSSIMGSVPRPRLGIASGMISQMRYTGQALGIAVGGAVVASRTPVHIQDLAGTLSQSLVEREAFILAMHDAFYVGAAICIVGIFTSLIRGRES
ncbi:MAG: MFS transporter, partial [Rubrobacter sp.]|nr:MFS transporter [Rubrobacter sp.]